jgi:hypothetical protein
MRRLLIPTLAALAAAAITAGIALAGHSHRDGDPGFGHDEHHAYAIGLWGDLPYSTTQATVGVPNLIADMNSQDLAFTAHDGDLKAGSTECTDAVYTQALAYFNSLRAPAVFTPGDNDWVDCDRIAGYSTALNQVYRVFLYRSAIADPGSPASSTGPFSAEDLANPFRPRRSRLA